MLRRSLLLAFAAALVAAGLAGCTSPGANEHTPSAHTTPIRTAAPSVAACALASEGKLTGPDGVANIPPHNGVGNIVFTNAGSGSCEVSGFPTLTFTDAAGKAIAYRVENNEADQFPDTPIKLAPGATGYAAIGIAALQRYPNCTPVVASKMTVSVSGATGSATIPLDGLSFCAPGSGAPGANESDVVVYRVTGTPGELS